jgi:hypothetical protein
MKWNLFVRFFLILFFFCSFTFARLKTAFWEKEQQSLPTLNFVFFWKEKKLRNIVEKKLNSYTHSSRFNKKIYTHFVLHIQLKEKKIYKYLSMWDVLDIHIKMTFVETVCARNTLNLK